MSKLEIIMSKKAKDDPSKYTKFTIVFTGPENLNKVMAEHIVRNGLIERGEGVPLAGYYESESKEPESPDLN